MRAVPRRVAVPFLLAAVGVLFMFGVVIAVLAGTIALFVYAAFIVAPLAVSALQARRRRTRLSAGRTCSCCTGTVHDPVQVI
jgi:hypothetical protein